MFYTIVTINTWRSVPRPSWFSQGKTETVNVLMEAESIVLSLL